MHAGGTPCGIEHAHSATCDDGMGSPSGGVFCGVVGPSAATFLGGCGAFMEMVPYPSAGSRRGGAEWGLESGLAFVCGLGRRVTLGLFAATWAFGISSGAHTPDDSAKGGKVGAYRRDAVKSSSILNITALSRILFFLCFSMVCSCSQKNLVCERGAAPYCRRHVDGDRQHLQNLGSFGPFGVALENVSMVQTCQILQIPPRYNGSLKVQLYLGSLLTFACFPSPSGALSRYSKVFRRVPLCGAGKIRVSPQSIEPCTQKPSYFPCN